MTTNGTEQQRKIRNGALLFAGIALVFFIGFIMLGVLRA